MDIYGIGNAMILAAETYSQTARRTGRTTTMIKTLRDGDRIICHSQNYANMLAHECCRLGIGARVIVVDPTDRLKLSSIDVNLSGKTIFDHVWVELAYAAAIRDCQRMIDESQTWLSTEHILPPNGDGPRWHDR